jgi:hypothetical protein
VINGAKMALNYLLTFPLWLYVGLEYSFTPPHIGAPGGIRTHNRLIRSQIEDYRYHKAGTGLFDSTPMVVAIFSRIFQSLIVPGNHA